MPRIRRSKWRYNVRVRYGLALEEYEAILARGCSICGSHEDMCLDHDHKKNSVRAGLCRPCNRGLGFFEENMERLRRGADYLEAHEIQFEEAH